MKPLRISKKWLLATIGLLLALLILKILLLLIAEPKITVNYLAEYNRTARPRNYDPNENAALYYQKAFDAFVDMPDKLQKPYINWCADFNDIERELLQKWVISNTLAFEYFRGALNKPYYWLERRAKKDNYIGSITTPDLAQLRKLTEVLTWDAKLNAFKGRFRLAFENILGCYKAGNHKCRPNLILMGQHTGLRIKQDTVRSAFIILDNSKVEDKALRFLQNALQSELNNDDYIPDIRAEKYFLYDALQRTFIDNGKGTGRLAWRTGWYYEMLYDERNNFRRRLYACFTGPTKNEIVGQIEKILTISGQIMAKTPWQIKNEAYDYFGEIKNINNGNWFLQIFGTTPKSIFHSYHKTRAQTDALVAVLAILRYKADTGQFPKSLDKLVSASYLQSVPMDSYSDGALVYKLTEDNFKLYSIGENFKDEGGAVKLDIVYWPIQQHNMIRSTIYQKTDASLVERFESRY